jgi:hypothetical protein
LAPSSLNDMTEFTFLQFTVFKFWLVLEAQ